jgi:hypothetical protein
VSRRQRIAFGVIGLLLTVAGIGVPIAVRFVLHRVGLVNNAWFITALAADLVVVLLLGLAAGVGAYLLTQP